MIYFGHLRHWDPKELAKSMQTGVPEVAQQAEQLVAMAKIAWRKHAALQFSLIALVTGIGCLLIVARWSAARPQIPMVKPNRNAPPRCGAFRGTGRRDMPCPEREESDME